MHLLPMVTYVVFHTIPMQVIIRLVAQQLVGDVTSTFLQKGTHCHETIHYIFVCQNVAHQSLTMICVPCWGPLIVTTR